MYEAYKAAAPALGSLVDTPQGSGRVVGHDVPRDEVRVRLDDGGRRCSCSRADDCKPRQAHDEAYGSL